VKHLAKDKGKGNRSLIAALQQLENHWIDKLEDHPFMKNGRQSAYDQGYDEGFDEAKKKNRLKKGKEWAAMPDAEQEKLKARIVQLEHEKAKITGENKRLQRRVDDLLREAANLRETTLLLQCEPPLPYNEVTGPPSLYQSIAMDPILLHAEPYHWGIVGNHSVNSVGVTRIGETKGARDHPRGAAGQRKEGQSAQTPDNHPECQNDAAAAV
jgi:hypothetical protein